MTGWLTAGRAPIHSEQAFRQLLAIERERAGRSRRSCLLVLVSARREADERPRRRAAGTLAGALGACVREVDVVGWFREGRVAGAVLIQPHEMQTEAADHIADRVRRAVGACRAAGGSGGVRVRVIRLGPR